MTVTKSQRKGRYLSWVREDDSICASVVYDTSSKIAPNKPFITTNKSASIYKHPTLSSRNAYTQDYIGSHNVSEMDTTPTKMSMNNTISKEISFEKVETTSSNRPPAQTQNTSFGFGIFSKITNWLTKELTVFPWKWEEQDETLNWCARAGRWVRIVEKLRSGVVDQQKYFQEYQDLKSLIHRNYSADPNDSIDTITHYKFESQQIQIEKDIDRTLNNHDYFGDGKQGQEYLREILKILALKYTDIGYVQGMNFLVVAFLYHCSPEITLFLITVLIEDYELWDVYRVDVSGLHQRNGEMKNLIAKKLPALNDHFTEIGIDSQMFTTEWVLDLFSHIIPLNFYGKFLDSFFQDYSTKKNENWDWAYFYQVVIWILSTLQKELVQKWEWDEVLVFIKNFVKSKNSNINWDKVLNSAKKLT